jgi:hypothetical protein
MSTQLEAWNDGAAISAILDFVTRVTTPGGPSFVPLTDPISGRD